MTRSDLIKAIADGTEATQAATKAFLEELESVVKQDLMSGGDTLLAGIGRISVVDRAPKKAFGKVIPARKSLKFKPSAKIQLELN